MRQNYPEAYAIWMRCEAKQGQLLLGTGSGQAEPDSGRSKKGDPQENQNSKQDYVDNK